MFSDAVILAAISPEMAKIIEILLGILQPAIGVLVMALVIKIMGWIGLKRDAELEKALAEKIYKGISYAEQLSINKLKETSIKMGSDNKKQTALQFILTEIENTPALKKYTKGRLENLIESQFHALGLPHIDEEEENKPQLLNETTDGNCYVTTDGDC